MRRHHPSAVDNRRLENKFKGEIKVLKYCLNKPRKMPFEGIVAAKK